jgi:hypothetical protein
MIEEKGRKGGKVPMTERTFTELAADFYNAIRGFIVIQESGLPEYVEFLTEEKIDLILLAGLLSGLQSLAEVVSDEKIRAIETSNSKFIFEIRSGLFHVIWIEKTIHEIEKYEPIIRKIISRFEGASKKDIKNKLLISNLTETPEYEKIGKRLMRIRSNAPRSFVTYKNLYNDVKEEQFDYITKVFAGIDGLLVIEEDGEILHQEFTMGKPIFNVPILVDFIVGLRKSIRNLDPGRLEEITTQNYRFIIINNKHYFYVFQVIKGLANEETLDNTIRKLMSRFEGLNKKKDQKITLLENFDTITEHELIGQLSIEMKERNEKRYGEEQKLERQRGKLSFGNTKREWKEEKEQFYHFMDIFPEVFLTGIITPDDRCFVIRKTPDINDWIQSAKNIELNQLLAMLTNQKAEVAKMSYQGKEYRVIKIANNVVLFVILESESLAAERFMRRLPKVFKKISPIAN